MSDTPMNHPEILLDLFGRNLVAVVLRVVDLPADPSQGATRQILFPGILLCVRDKYFFLTAGHVLNQIDQELSKGKFVIGSAMLVDVFGKDRVSDYPIQFDFSSAVRHHVDDDVNGLDIGLIELDNYYVRLLEANRVLPVREINWAKQHTVSFELYFVLGFPIELNPTDKPIPGQTALSPLLVPVYPVAEVPEDVRREGNDRFCGQIS